MIRRHPFVLPFLFLASLLQAAPAALAQQPPSPVRVDAVRVESVRDVRRVTGEIWARKRALVASEEDGLTITLPVDVGDRVSQGQLLAELDSTILRAQLTQAQAALAQEESRVPEYEALLERAQRDMARMNDLRDRGAAREKEFDDAETDLKTATARLQIAIRAVDVARSHVDQLNRRLEKKTITAPFTGVIMRKETEVGNWVDAGGAILELLEAGHVDAVLDVPEQILAPLHIGDSIEVTIPALAIAAASEPRSSTLTGTIRAIVPEADRAARTFPVKIDLDDLDGLLRPGMSVSAMIPTGARIDALTIDRDAIFQSPQGPMVYIVQGPVVAPAIVQVTSSAGPDRVAVAAGPVKPGDLLVVEGNERLFPGAPVQVVGQQDAAAAPETDSPPPSADDPLSR